MSDRALDRRTLLRRGGIAAAGLAGAGAAASLTIPGAASAATGDNAVLGVSNTADQTTAVVGTSATDPTLSLASVDGTVAQLRLTNNGYPTDPNPDVNVVEGDLFSRDGLFYGDGAGSASQVYTVATANMLVPITPVRFVDTGTAGGRANILTTGTYVDSAGRLLAGRTIQISLDQYLQDAQAIAVHMNIEAQNAVKTGYLSVWPNGTRPGVAAVCFNAGSTQSISGFSICALAQAGSTYLNTFSLYTSQTTRIYLDAVAFSVGSPYDVVGTQPPAAARPSVTARKRTIRNRSLPRRG